MGKPKVDKDVKRAAKRRSAARLHLVAELDFDPLSGWTPQNQKPDAASLMFEALRRGVGKKPAGPRALTAGCRSPPQTLRMLPLAFRWLRARHRVCAVRCC